jgi:hypothetical protein
MSNDYRTVCDILQEFPPKNELALNQIISDVGPLSCDVEPIRKSSPLRGFGDAACEVVSEFAPRGTQHMVERACKSIIGR